MLLRAAAAAGFSSSLFSVAIGELVPLLLFLGALAASIPYVYAQRMRGQTQAKDEVIKTNEQTIVAMQHHIDRLNREVADRNAAVEAARVRMETYRSDLAEATGRYESLEEVAARYSAPEAVKDFSAQFATFAAAQNDLTLHLLEEVQGLAGRVSIVDVREPGDRRERDVGPAGQERRAAPRRKPTE